MTDVGGGGGISVGVGAGGGGQDPPSSLTLTDRRERARCQRGTFDQGRSLSTRGSPGKPSTCSPRMLRMISDVPPSIELARTRRNAYPGPWLAPVASSMSGRRNV